MYTLYDRCVSNPLRFVLLVSKSIVRSFNTVGHESQLHTTPQLCFACGVCVRAALPRALVQQAVVRHLQAGPQD
jgi:heterodisulfide reductase subunit C